MCVSTRARASLMRGFVSVSVCGRKQIHTKARSSVVLCYLIILCVCVCVCVRA